MEHGMTRGTGPAPTADRLAGALIGALALLAALVLSVPAFAAPHHEPAGGSLVTALTPDEAGPGMEFTVTGHGFGELKPRAWLVSDEKPKPRRLKVVEFADDRLVLRVRRAPLGAYRLRIRPRGGEAFETELAFEVGAPRLLRIEPPVIALGEDVRVFGQNLGPKGRYKLRFETNRAPVELDVSEQVLHTRAVGETGLVRVQLNSRHGATAIGYVIVHEPGAAPSSPPFSAYVGGEVPWDTWSVLPTRALPDGRLEMTTRSQRGKTTSFLQIELPVDLAGVFPQVWSGPDVTADIEVTWFCTALPVPKGQGGCGAASVLLRLDRSEPWHVAVLGREGDQLVGTFSGKLGPFAGLHYLVEDGSFRIDLPAAP